MGRFINADALVSTGQGILGNNMFAYCYNNPANMYDVEGTDAIWIQEPNSAIYNGHSGLLVQDKDENWYYFFWGPVGEELPDVITGTQSRCIVIQVFPEDGSLDSLEDVRNAIANLSNRYPGYADADYAAERAELIGTIMYLEGDYSATYEYLIELKERSAKLKYRLLTNNCVQYTCIALGQSNDYFNRIPNVVRPNIVFYLTILNDLADQPVYFSDGK